MDEQVQKLSSAHAMISETPVKKSILLRENYLFSLCGTSWSLPTVQFIGEQANKTSTFFKATMKQEYPWCLY